MLPRAMDEALEYPLVEAFKFVSIPLIGMLFRDSMAKLNHNKNSSYTHALPLHSRY